MVNSLSYTKVSIKNIGTEGFFFFGFVNNWFIFEKKSCINSSFIRIYKMLHHLSGGITDYFHDEH